jgi:hypothetical protein
VTVQDIPIYRNSFNTSYTTAINYSGGPAGHTPTMKNFSNATELADSNQHLEKYAKDNFNYVSGTSFTIPLRNYITNSGLYTFEVWTHTPNQYAAGGGGGWGWNKIPIGGVATDTTLDVDFEIKVENMNIIQAPK